MSTDGVPVLWHLKVSHYNEKARWALDYKRIPHERRALPPGRHQEVAERLGGGRTFPVLELDGEVFGDSTLIIQALERRFPDPPLYPADPGEQARALEIEDFFDEQLGSYARLLTIHHMLPDAALTLGAMMPDLTGLPRVGARAMFPLLRRRLRAALSIDELSVEHAWLKVRAAAERFSMELQPNGYLVGAGLTVADLTVAALVAPAVAPDQFPYPQPQRGHPRLEPIRNALAETGLLEWTRHIYARHRGISAEIGR